MRAKALKGAFPVIFLTIVVAVSVTLLGFIDSITREQIAYQEELKIQKMLAELFPEMSEYTLADGVYTIYTDGVNIGYAFLAEGKGYGGEISILVGLEDEDTVKGVTIITHSETPGLGSRITGEDFTAQFAGINIDGVALRRDGGQIDALTGATISSRAVVEAVKAEAMARVSALKGGE